jgi:deoxyadenosine/deoxycytidine kinase
MHIAIAGNIGVGKTSLTELLCKHYDWTPHYEDTDKNPYLPDFYEDMQRWAFNLQIYFVTSRFKTILDIKKLGETVVQDRTIYEDAYIFAANLHSMGLMSTRDHNNYKSLFDLMMTLVKPPDLIIYLRSSVPKLVSQIQKRGRKYETNIRLDYLKRLNERYEAWAENYNEGKIVKIDLDDRDFVSKTEDLNHIMNIINREVHGLF